MPETPESSIYSPADLEALELPSLLAVIAQLAATDLGAERLLSLEPARDEEELRRRRAWFEEAQPLLLEGGRWVPSSEEPLEPILEGLATGRPPVSGSHLVRLSAALKAVGEARRRILAVGEDAPHLAELVQGGAPEDSSLASAALEDLRRKIDKRLDRRGRVKEGATPLLTQLRGRIRKVRESLYRDLRGYVQSHGDHLSEETIPLREGRLVLTLQAGSRGRLQGLTHGKSGTGKSFYFEPLEVVEANNDLRQGLEDEEEEQRRIVLELVTQARQALPELRAATELLGLLDLVQAATDFARRVDGRQVALAGAGDLRLTGARHPLLDARLADLRATALGEPGHQGEVVPLDLALEPERRVLVVTGPNAGGKTVALKTLGLLSLATLCGLPVPAGLGSRVPFLHLVLASIGDDQDLLRDRSTFSGRLLRLKSIWQRTDRRTLVLLDELGSGTDPVEGAALSGVLLEALVKRGVLAVITTHLVSLAAEAMELDGAACAAMEFDGATATPTFRLLPGPPGGSEALALARRLGLPAAWLDRAEERLGSEHRDLRRLLSEVEALRRNLEEERETLSREVSDAEALRRRLTEEEEALRQERKKLSGTLRRELEDFRRETRHRLEDEQRRLQKEAREAAERRAGAGKGAGLSKGAAKAVNRAVDRIFDQAPSLPAEVDESTVAENLPLEVGASVRHRGLGWEGRLEKLDGERAEVAVRGKRVRAKAEELVAIPPDTKAGKSAGKRAAERPGAAADLDTEVPRELNLVGQRVEPALEALDHYLDQALLGASDRVRIIHGHGTGQLRRAVRERLRHHRAVAEFQPGAANEGGDGATVAVLRA